MKQTINGKFSRSAARTTYAIFTAALCLLAFTSAHSLRAAAPAPVVKADAKVGETIFMQKCFQCHSVVDGETRVGPSLYHELKKPKPKKTDAEVRLIIKNGKNKMPAWGAILSAEDTDNILAYIHTL